MYEHVVEVAGTEEPEINAVQVKSPAQLAYEGVKQLVDTGYLEPERFQEILHGIQPSQ